MHLRRSIVALFFILLAAGSLSACAQAVPAAYSQHFSINVGVMGSAFQPDYKGGLITQTGPYRLYGPGAYVDVKLTRWVQFEAEARWLRVNPYLDIRQDNYLIGPRLPLERLRYKRATPYAKILAGYGRMNLELNSGWFRSADIAYGGGVDVKLTKKITIRAIDFEYQQWPQNWLNSTLSPYGGSVGVSYKVF
jgi:hypothetical protein